ncbi:MAG: hypothetical protein KF908_05360 [Nitrosomonas sp.]|nr:hypothetical protein [Nitrosomonas sp.]
MTRSGRMISTISSNRRPPRPGKLDRHSWQHHQAALHHSQVGLELAQRANRICFSQHSPAADDLWWLC